MIENHNETIDEFLARHASDVEEAIRKAAATEISTGTESAGYHGYWITDFTQIDPHLGTNAEMEALVEAAERRARARVGDAGYDAARAAGTAHVFHHDGAEPGAVPRAPCTRPRDRPASLHVHDRIERANGRSASVPTVSIGQPNAQGDLDKAIIRRYGYEVR